MSLLSSLHQTGLDLIKSVSEMRMCDIQKLDGRNLIELDLKNTV